MKLSIMTRAIFYTLAVAGLVACGGSGGSSDSDIESSTPSAPSGSTVVGTIAGFGSIIMNNGVEYETDGLSDCEVDDDDVAGKCEDSLSTGMHVTLKLNASGAVTSLKYDDELEGVASNVSGDDGSGNYTFEIYGVTITTTSPETQWDDFSANPPTIAELDGANIEVSGEWQLVDGTVIASYVEKQSDSDSHEVKGTVGVITGDGFPLTLRNGATIAVDASAVGQLPVEGDFVEVKGSYNGIIFTATEFEIEDEDDFDGDSEAEITGTLAENSASPGGYSIGNTDVDISGAPSCMALIGLMVEAEGTYQDSGVLVVKECENEDEDEDMEAKCQVVEDATVLPEKPKVGSVICGFPGTTGDPLTIKFNDSPDLAMFSNDSTASTFDLNDVDEGDCVEIKFSKDANGDYIAGLIEHEGSGGCDSTELEATVDVFDIGSVTVAGVKFRTDDTTEYDPDSDSLGIGVKVKIEDNLPDGEPDGNADNIEIDD